MVRKVRIDNTKICSSCQESKSTGTDYYKASNTFINSDGYMCICKECLKSLAGEFMSTDDAKNILRSVDKPFLQQVYDKACEKGDVFGEYMKLVNNRSRIELTWEDSDYDIESEDVEVNGNASISQLKREFGTDFSNEELREMDTYYSQLLNSYDSSLMKKRLFKQIVILETRASKAMMSGSTKDFDVYNKNLTSLRKDAGINPSQETDSRGVNTMGEIIAEMENSQPCDVFIDKYADYDGFSKYMKRTMERSLKNTMLDETDFEEEGIPIPTPPEKEVK